MSCAGNSYPWKDFKMSQPIQRAASFATLSLLAVTLFVLTGCNDKNETANPESAATETQTDSSAPLSSSTNSVAVVKSTNLASPATSPNQPPDPDSTPDQVCQRFLNLLQSGNRIAAENLLTRTALTATTKAGLKLEPMGGPTSTYRIGEVRYATNKQKLAHVDTYVVDKVDGNPYEMEVTWQLHKHGDGWRISGVMLELEEGKTKDLLSLENKYDIARLQSLVGAEVLDQTETRQSKIPPNSDSPKVQ
jgi:hypothetical protein